MEIHNGIKYNSNYARAATCFLGTRGKRPVQQTRQAAYDFITSFYTLIAENPQKLWRTISEDIWFEPFEMQKERQKDVKTIRTTLDNVEQLIKELFDLSVLGEVNDNGFKLPDDYKPKKILEKAFNELGIVYKKDS